jgi:membrane-bound lytic murein transglycosylase A
MPLPDARPSAKIAKLFPQTDPLKDQKNGAKPADISATTGGTTKTSGHATNATATPQASTTRTAAAETIPLPEARPATAPVREVHRHRRHYRYHRGQ